MEQGDCNFATEQTIGIIGLGLIGGSYAKGLRRLGAAKILAVDVDEKALQAALADGVIDEGHRAGGEFLAQADMLIFCMAADAMLEFIRRNAAYFKDGAVLTDVTGIKDDMARIIEAMLPDGVDFISGHPMAGREGKGYGMSQAEIFDGANYIIVPSPANKAEHIGRVRAMAYALGCAHVVTVSPEEHDKLIAYTSSLPHVLATALVNSEAMSPMTKFFVAGSFRDGTRVADINAPLWTKLFLSNKENLLYEIDRFGDALQTFADMLRREDTPAITQYLQQAAMRRRELVHEKHTH